MRRRAVIPVARPLKTECFPQNLREYYHLNNKKYLRGMCRFAGIEDVILSNLDFIDNQLALAEKNHFMEPFEQEEIEKNLFEILEKMNNFAKNNMLYTATYDVRSKIDKKNPNAEEKYRQELMTDFFKDMAEVNLKLETRVHRAVSLTFTEGLQHAVRYLCRNLIFGSLAMLGMGLAYAGLSALHVLSCFHPSTKPRNFKHWMYKAAGLEQAVIRVDIQQSNMKLANRLEPAVVKWMIGESKTPKSTLNFSFFKKEKARERTTEEKQNHLTIKKRLVSV
jgi:hypothetical protein